MCIVNKTMNTIHKNFLRLVDLTDSQELKGDHKTRREILAIMDDFLVVLERTKLHCPDVNLYDEEVMISLVRTESIKQIKFSEKYHKIFFFDIIREAIKSLQYIINHFHRSMYGYNQTTREFLTYCADKLNTGLVDFESQLAKVIKPKGDKDMYATIQEELLKFFGNCNSVFEWIVDTSLGSNLKQNAGIEGDNAEEEDESESGVKSLQEDEEVFIDNQKIIASLILAKSQNAKEASPVDELIKSLRRKCKIGDVHSEFEDSDSLSYHELQRRLISDYVLLSRRFTREINVLFGITNKICLRKVRFNKNYCDCEVCNGE